MKKPYLFTLLLSAVLLAVASCRKEDGQISMRTNHPDDAKITGMILNFKSSMHLKSSITLPPDSAEWYVEGLLNYEKANNDHQIADISFIRDSVMIPEVNGNISLEQLAVAYDYFELILDENAAQAGSQEFKYDVVDISITEENPSTGLLKAVMVAGGGFAPLGPYVPFASDDYWYWAWNMGKCNGYGGGSGSDAADLLEYKINHPVLGPPGGPVLYYTDIQEIHTWFNDSRWDDISNPGPYCDKMIFVFVLPNNSPTPCLAPDELDYYLNKFPFIEVTLRPSGKEFICIDIAEDIFTTTNYMNGFYHYYLNYGIPHRSQNN